MAQNVGTLLGSAIRPADSLDEFPVFHANEGLGGFYSVQDIAARDAITSSRRVEGMRIRVIDEAKDYELVDGITNADWVEVASGTEYVAGQNITIDPVTNEISAFLPSVLIREEFDFTGSQIITLANDYSQVYVVSVSNGGVLKSNEYTLVLPNQINFNDTLESDDHIVVLYSNTEVGTQPYYTQAQVDVLIQNTSRTIETTLPNNGIVIDGLKTYYIDSGIISIAGTGHVEGKDIEIICNPLFGANLAIDLRNYPLVQIQGGGFTESPFNYYTLQTEGDSQVLRQHFVLLLWRRNNLFISNSENYIANPNYVPPLEIENYDNVIAFWKEGEGDNVTGVASKTDIKNNKVLTASGETNPLLLGSEWSFNGVNQGFKINDIEINNLLNQDEKDFQIHYKGSFNSTGARILSATKIGSSPASLWNMVYNLLGNSAQLSLYDAQASEISSNILNPLQPLGTEYLISIKFHRTNLGIGTRNYIDVILNDGNVITSSLNIDASILNESEINTVFIGMRETTSKSYYSVNWKSLVIANTSEYFNEIKEALW